MDMNAEIKGISGTVAGIGEKVDSYKMQIKSLTDAVAEMQKKSALTGTAGGNVMSPEYKQMLEYIGGRADVPGTKASASGTGAVLNGPNGGYLAVEEYANKVITKMIDENPLLPEIEMFNISANIMGLPVERGIPSASFLGELDKVSDSNLNLTMVNIPVKQMAVKIPLSRVLLRSANIVNVEQYAIERTSKAIAHKMGQVILNGDGVTQPQGILNAKDLKTVKSGAAASVTSDQLFAAVGSIPEEANANAKWFMSRKTFFDIAGVLGKDSNFINMGWGESVPKTLFGYPVVLCGDMPNLAAGSKSILFGDMRAAYKGVQSGPLEFLRDEYTSADQNTVNMRYWTGLGGALVQPEAIIAVKTGA